MSVFEMNPASIYNLSKILQRQNTSFRDLSDRLLALSQSQRAPPAILDVAEKGLKSSDKHLQQLALQSLSELGKAGDPQALLRLGEVSRQAGKTKEARTLFSKAADGGLAMGWVSLARMEIQNQDLVEARKYLALAAAKECTEAYSIQAHLTNDTATKINILQKAAALGSREVAHNLGDIYRRQQNTELSKDWFEVAAQSGFQVSQYNLAMLLKEETALSDAKYWFSMVKVGGGEIGLDAEKQLKDME